MSEWDWGLNLSSPHPSKHLLRRNTTKTGAYMPPDHHNSHPRSRGDSEPGPCFLFIAACSDGPLVPAGAHRLFSGPTYMRESDVAERNKKKATELSFSGAQTPGSLPQIHVQTAFCAPSRPFLPPSGHHGHTRPRSSPPTTSPACSRKQSSVVLHSGSVRCLRSSGANAGTRARWSRSKSVRSKGSLHTHRKPASSHPSAMPQRNKSTGRQPGGRSAFCARRDKKMPPERPSKTAKIHAFARAKSSPSFQRA